MKKPSIFSKDYERLMRKRRKRIRIISTLVGLLFIVLISGIALKVDLKQYSYKGIVKLFTNTKNKSYDKSKNENIENIEEENEKSENDNEDNLEKEKVNLTSIIDVNINNSLIKVEIMNTDEGKSIISIKNDFKDINYKISPNSKLAVIIDEKQNMYLVDCEGKFIDLTLKEYISPQGEVFEKENVIQTYEGYLWHTEARFLNDNMIIYISNIPYFGQNLNKYLSIVDIGSKNHKTIWASKGKDIVFGDYNDNGLGVTIDGNIRIVDKDGNIQ